MATCEDTLEGVPGIPAIKKNMMPKC